MVDSTNRVTALLCNTSYTQKASSRCRYVGNNLPGHLFAYQAINLSEGGIVELEGTRFKAISIHCKDCWIHIPK